jgi:hypothetical protein
MRTFAGKVLRSLTGVLDLGMTRVDIQTYAWTDTNGLCDPENSNWMKKTQKMLVWLSKMVLVQRL